MNSRGSGVFPSSVVSALRSRNAVAAPREKLTLRCYTSAASTGDQCSASNLMGKMVVPLNAVSGFHGAGPVRRALGMRLVVTARESGGAATPSDTQELEVPQPHLEHRSD
jgi:hypothetical protein